MDHIGPARRLAAMIGATAGWLVLAHLSRFDVVNPSAAAWFAPAALTLVLGMTIGADALTIPLAAAILNLGLEGQTDRSIITLTIYIAVIHGAVYGSAGMWLRRRRYDLRNSGSRDLYALIAIGAVGAPLVVASLHTLVAHRLGLGTGQPLPEQLLGWATADSVAVLIGAPLPFALRAAWHERRPLRRVIVLENPTWDRALACGQVALIAISVTIAFSIGGPTNPPLYLTAPALLWITATRGYRFAALAMALFGIGLWLTRGEYGLIDPTPLRLQIVATAAFTLAVGAQVDDRRRSAAMFERMNHKLRMSEARYRSVIENAADGMVVMNERGVVEVTNAAVERLFGVSRDGIEGKSITSLLPAPTDVEDSDYIRMMMEAKSSGSGGDRYWIGRRSDGTTFPLRLGVSRVATEHRTTYTLILHDESERQEFEAQLEHQATHDLLTDLPNRALFQDRLVTALERLRRQPGALALFLIDLDRFKAINDQLGHAVGDSVLQEAAARLRDAVRRSDTVARLGGDEFAVLLGPSIDAAAAAATASRALDRLREPYVGVPASLTPTASVGIRLVHQPHTDPAELLRHADLALYQAKREGKDCFRFFSSPELGVSTPEEIDLREGLSDGAVVVRYQPVIDAEDGRVTTIEALARLRRRDGTLLPPKDFVPIAERSALIDRLGELVLRRALMDLYPLRRDIDERLTVSVNVSPEQLRNRRFPEVVFDALSVAGLTVDALVLEVTETASLPDIPGAYDVLRTLANRGVAIALDDFGVGQTRFDTLRELPVSALKIDRSFVSRIIESPADHDIVEAIVLLARKRGIRVVAEGVESIDLVDELIDLGCTHLQGFLFSRPTGIDELTVLLKQWRAIPVIATRKRA